MHKGSGNVPDSSQIIHLFVWKLTFQLDLHHTAAESVPELQYFLIRKGFG